MFGIQRCWNCKRLIEQQKKHLKTIREMREDYIFMETQRNIAREQAKKKYQEADLSLIPLKALLDEIKRRDGVVVEALEGLREKITINSR